MSFGKMNTFIELISREPAKDAEGFTSTGVTILASVRAYREERHGSEKWANRAAFSAATALFRFRKISGIVVDTSMFIACDTGRYRIVSADNDVKGRGLYVEVLAEIVTPAVR